MNISKRHRSRLHIYVFIIGFILAFLLRLLPAFEIEIFTIDELTSLLAATGHLGEYYQMYNENESPIGAWVAGSEWKQFLQIETVLGFDTIAEDLFFWDIHPPLYFWLLHIWISIVGTHYWTGVLLNWLIGLITFLVIFLLGRDLFSDIETAILAGVIWSLSPISLLSSAITRQYTLLTLWSALFALLLFRFLTRPGRWKLLTLLFLLLLAIIGTLTHYNFLLVLMAGVLVYLFVREKSWAVLIIVLVFVISASIFVILFFLQDSFSVFNFIQRSIAPTLVSRGRLLETVKFSILLFIPLLLSLAITAYAWIYRKRIRGSRFQWFNLNSFRHWLGDEQQIGRPLLLFLLVIPYLVFVILFIFGFFPPHSMKPRYFEYLTPFAAILAVLILQKTPSQRVAKLILLGGLAIIATISIWGEIQGISKRQRLDMSPLDENQRVLIDYVVRPVLVLHLDDDHLVFANNQQALLDQPGKWLFDLVADGGIYISFVIDDRFGRSTFSNREQILNLIDELGSYHLIKEIRKPPGTVAIYEIGK